MSFSRSWLFAAVLLAGCSTHPHASDGDAHARAAMPAATPAAQPSLAPGERRIRASDGAELYLKVAGHGPVCVLVHGGPGQGALSTEKMGADKLEGELTMVYLDQRGSGRSPDTSNYHLDRVVQDVEDVRQALGVDRICLIAHSFGGILAVDYARRHPQHVSKLVMANTILHFRSAGHARMQIAFADRLLGRETAALPEQADAATVTKAHDAARKALMDSGNGYRFLTENRDAVRVMGDIDGSYPRSMGFGTAVITRPDLYPEYMLDYAPATADIHAPVLVISGSKDYAVGPDEYRRFRFPEQQTVILDSGHMSYYEKTDAFVAAISAFMRPAAR